MTSENEVLEFLDELYVGVEEGWLSTFTVDRTATAGAERHVDWANLEDRDQIDLLVARTMERAGTDCAWFGVATRRENLGAKRGGKKDCTWVTALWVDLDVAGPGHKAEDLPATREEALRILGLFPLPPTVLVDSGGGYQAWWFLDEPLSVDEAGPLLERWGATWNELANKEDA